MLAHPLEQSPGWEVPLAPTWAQEPPNTIHGLKQLAVQGRWRDAVATCRSLTPSDRPCQLALTAFHVLALIKLQQFGDAAKELGQVPELASFSGAACVWVCQWREGERGCVQEHDVSCCDTAGSWNCKDVSARSCSSG